VEDLENINFSFDKAYELVNGKLIEWLETAIKLLPNFVVAVLLLLAFVLLAKLTKKIFFKISGRITDNLSLQRLLASIIYISVITIGTFIALSVLKLDKAVTSLLAGAGVIGLALGFAFQDIASNFIAGTMMSIRKPFKIGDLIETNDFFGTVKSIHLRTTEIQTLQGQMVLIPNSMIFKNPINNFSYAGRRRIDIEVGVTYDTDLPFAKKIAQEAINEIEDVFDVSIFYTAFDSSSINFTIRYWINFSNKQAMWLAKQDEGIIAIKKAFDKNNITIPFPIRTLDIDTEKLAQSFGKK